MIISRLSSHAIDRMRMEFGSKMPPVQKIVNVAQKCANQGWKLNDDRTDSVFVVLPGSGVFAVSKDGNINTFIGIGRLSEGRAKRAYDLFGKKKP